MSCPSNSAGTGAESIQEGIHIKFLVFAYFLFHGRRHVYKTKNISLLLPTCHAHVVVFLIVWKSVPFVDVFDADVISDSFFF